MKVRKPPPNCTGTGFWRDRLADDPGTRDAATPGARWPAPNC
ncbi:hypothetical protein ACFY20_43830 [Streptomyces sp. NPDC001312]